MTTHIQLDLETLGLRVGSAIMSIGIVVFDFENSPGGEDQGEIEAHLSLHEQIKVGMETDPDTILFWMEQDEDARMQAVEGQKMNALPVHMALAQINETLEEFCGQSLEDEDVLDLKVWSNGANFDAPMLRELYRRFGIRCPWGWWNERCHRTLVRAYKDALGQTAHGWPNTPERTGTYHNALEDARHQAEVLTYLHVQLYEQLHRKIEPGPFDSWIPDS